MRSQSLSPSDVNYPELLRNIYSPPKKLNVWGEFPDFETHPPVAVIGSRKPTEYGRENVHNITAGLANAGFTIISGLAYGIDSLAHRTSLEAKGLTIAVLGSGLENIYPASHKKLAEAIVEGGGAVITEFEPKAAPLPQNFPIRNRIISGMSLGVVLIEAAIESGSLITARLAMEQGREVFAVPGPIGNVNTAGTHMLIREGAALIESAQDIIDILESKLGTAWKTKFSGQSFGIGDKERRLLRLLGDEPKTLDALIESGGFTAAEAAGIITTLECAGCIKEESGRGYVKTIYD